MNRKAMSRRNADIITLAKTELTLREIGERLGVTGSHVSRTLRRLGVKRSYDGRSDYSGPRSSKENRKRDGKFLQLVASGHSMSDLGREYGLSRQRVFQIVKCQEERNRSAKIIRPDRETIEVIILAFEPEGWITGHRGESA